MLKSHKFLSILSNKKVRSLLQIVISLSLLAFFISQIGLDTLISIFVEINPAWYLFAFVLFLLNVVLRAYRWFILLHSLNDRPSFLHLNYLYFLGFFANNFIPSGFGGDVVKVINLKQNYGRGAEALSSVMMDRLIGLMGSSFLALIALALNALGHTTPVELPPSLLIAVILISVAIPVGFFFLRWVDLLRLLENRFPKIKNLPYYLSLQNLIYTIKRYPLDILLKALLITLPFTISLVFIQYAIAIALNVDLPLALFFLFVPIISLVNLLPIAFNGLGTREAVYQLLFTPMGIPASYAIAMSLAFYLLRFSTGLIGGLMFALRSVLQFMRTPHTKNI